MSNQPSARRDWFAVERRVFEHPVLAGEFDRRSAWLWLIANAAWRPHQVRTRGGIVKLERGQVLVGGEHLAALFGWSRKTVRTFLAELRAQGMIEVGQREGQYANVATISNYGRYQGAAEVNGPAEGPTKGQRGANEGPHRRKERKDRRVEARAHASESDDTEATSERSILHVALADYNRAAETLGFARCSTLSDARAKRLVKRLRELGQDNLDAGARRFREALSAIPHWRFIAGLERGRNGRSPFKLDLDRLLSADSGLGDVLAKLCDLYDEHGAADARTGTAPPPCSSSSFASAWAEAQAEELAAQRARFELDPTAEGGAPDAVH